MYVEAGSHCDTNVMTINVMGVTICCYNHYKVWIIHASKHYASNHGLNFNFNLFTCVCFCVHFISIILHLLTPHNHLIITYVLILHGISIFSPYYKQRLCIYKYMEIRMYISNGLKHMNRLNIYFLKLRMDSSYDVFITTFSKSFTRSWLSILFC
jgi:hypothetical protein